jgi:hypothetical protein
MFWSNKRTTTTSSSPSIVSTASSYSSSPCTNSITSPIELVLISSLSASSIISYSVTGAPILIAPCSGPSLQLVVENITCEYRLAAIVILKE